jgi:hypothetical protein
MIDFEECQSLYNAITTSLSVFKADKVWEDETIDGVGPLQSFFEHSVTDMMSVPHDYKYLQECSLACEPRIFGQGRRNKSNQDIIASQSCLTFPTVLDNCSLFHAVQQPRTSTQSVRPEPKPMDQRKNYRRRTHSFPPSNAHFASATRLDLLEGENSRTWLGSLISSRHQYASLLEAHKKNRDASYGPNGDILFPVQQGELVFKASALLFNQAKKTESAHSIEFLKKGKNRHSCLLKKILTSLYS